MENKAEIILSNNARFEGYFLGAKKSVSGELVFNTGMVGYVEAMTDPSYKGQILVFTYPLIGNYGVPDDSIEDKLMANFESNKIQVTGIIISDYSFNYSHFKAKKSLSQWMREQGVPGVYGVDTRELTKKLRVEGTMPTKILYKNQDLEFIDPNKFNLVKDVSIKRPVTYEKGAKKVLVIDCGVKLSIIKSLLKRDVSVIRVPYDYDISKVKENFDGVLISNGPGDPKMCEKTIENIKKLFEKELPILGICLGNQLLALAAGGDTYKLKFGHRSQNQPCVETKSNRCYITSQNHSYAVEKNLPTEWKPWFINNNDQTIEGISHKTKPFFSVQFHPEANPGPTDTGFVFDDFVKLL